VSAYPNDRTGTQAVKRTALYEQLWSVPATQLAVQYGISDVGLAKVCKRYRIPRPPRGYWAKLQAGKPVRRTPLPKATSPDQEIVYMKGWRMPGKVVQAAISDAQQKEPQVQTEIDVPLHPLAAAAREQLVEAKPDHDSLVQTDRAIALNIRVSPTCLDRAVTVFGTFIRAWEERGGEVRIEVSEGAKSGVTMAAIGPDGLRVRIQESLDEGKPLSDPSRRTGRLCFWIDGDPDRKFRRRWADTKSQRFERMVKPLVETLLHVLQEKRTERLDRECVQRQEQRVEQRRDAQAAEDSREFYWRQDLMVWVNRWHEAKRVREYVDALREAVESGQRQPQNEDAFQEWLAWADRFADSMDPMINAPMEEAEQQAPENLPVDQLDLTSETRAVVEALAVRDSTELWGKSVDEVRKACRGGSGRAWGEILQVLEGLGYDVSKRRDDYYWY